MPVTVPVAPLTLQPVEVVKPTKDKEVLSVKPDIFFIEEIDVVPAECLMTMRC